MTKRKYIYQEDDALIHGQDPDYRGIHEWWEKMYNCPFLKDWEAAKDTEEDHGDAFIRTITKNCAVLSVCYSFDGYSVREKEENA